MIAVFVLILAALAVAAVLVGTYWGMQQASELADLARRNAIRMDSVVGIVQAMSGPVVVGGPSRPPEGRMAGDEAGQSSGRYVLPAAAVGNERTPWGAFYGYCPSSVIATTQEEALLQGAPVQVAAEPSYGMRSVDVGGERRLLPEGDFARASAFVAGVRVPEVMGFVIAPAPNEFLLPSCSQIAYRDGAFVIGGSDTDGDGVVDAPATVMGTVRAVLPESHALRLGFAQQRPTLFVAPAGEGRGDGSDAANPMSLQNAFERWSVSPVADLGLSLAGGRYVLSDDLVAVPGSATMLTLSARAPGVQGSGVPEFFSTSAVDLVLPVPARIEGVRFVGGAGLRVSAGGTVSIKESRLTTLRIDGGDVQFEGPATIARTSGHARRAIEITAGRVSFAGDLDVTDDGAVDSMGAIGIVGGEVVFAGDVIARVGSGGLPWSLHGGEIAVGAKADGTRPVAIYGSDRVEMFGRVTARNEGCEGYRCEVTCPPLTGAVSGSCTTDDVAADPLMHVLSSFGRNDRGWACTWASDTVLRGTAESGYTYAQRSAPPRPVASAECVAGH